MNLFRSLLHWVYSKWDGFWFFEAPLLNLGCFRCLICAVLFLMDFSRQFDLKEFYTNQGLLPDSLSLSVIPEFYRPPFDWYFWNESSLSWAHGLLVAGLFLLMLGIGGRILNLILWILHIAFLFRNYSIAFGADLIGGIFLLLLIPTNSCARFSVMNLLGGRHRAKLKPAVLKEYLKPYTAMLTSVFYRLIQLQLCVVYIFTGMDKLKGQSWWDGTAIWTVLINPQMVVFDFSWLRQLPYVIAILTFSTVLFEMYFPVLVWNPKLRPFLLGLGVFFHLSVGICMALVNFGLIMIAPYLLFLDETVLTRAVNRLNSRFFKGRLLS